MKAILMSIRPQWVAKILNGEKTIEIRKKFPRDYVGWVYIYCTKEQGLARLNNGGWKNRYMCEKDITEKWFKQMCSGYDGKGKVVARFWCDKVEEIKPTDIYETFSTNPFDNQVYETCEWCKKSCLTFSELDNYLDGENGYAIHITKLEIFDKSKEISEFKTINPLRYPANLYRAPQSWQFIEV